MDKNGPFIEGSLEVKLPTIWTDEKQRWKESQRREEERERVRRKKQMREKVGKSRNTVVFPMICGSGGSKSRLAKAAGAEPSGQMRDEKLHAVFAQSTLHTMFGPLWELRCRKSARRCGAKHISKSKCTKHTMFGPLLETWDVEKVRAVVARSRFRSQNVQKHTMFGPLLEVEMWKKCTPLWREAHFKVKMYKAHHVRTTFGRSDPVSRGRRKGLCTLSKVSKTWWFCSIFKNDGRRGTFEEDLQRCIFRGRRTRDIFIGDVRRWVRWFSWEGVPPFLDHGLLRWIFAWQVDWKNHFFVAGAVLSTGGLEKSQNAMVRGRQLCTQLSIFWRKSRRIVRRIVSFLMLSSSKIEEVSQNCFVFDVVKFKNWGSLAK